ncbi:ferritin family protein [Sulfurospirillum sp.]|uniref:ferritin family protein n=1 Tax=Sulfurospirillum sp. TaxID=2053622 RepID=UPI002FDCD14D
MKTTQNVTEISSLEEVLQCAYDGEVKAYEIYSAVVETLGEVSPFLQIIQAEQTHQEALIAIAQVHNVTLVRNMPNHISIPKTLRECCELGVASEIQTLQRYNELLVHVTAHPEVQDLFYRLQAASFNNHLPAFRNAVVSCATPQPTAEGNPMVAFEGMMGQWGEFSQMAQKIAKGEINQEEITKLLSSNFSFVAGALLGAVGAGVLGGMMQADDEETEHESVSNDL